MVSPLMLALHFFSMSYEFTELFDYCKIPNPLEMNELNPVYSVYFAGKKEPYSIYKELIN
jgi:phytoene desaturase